MKKTVNKFLAVMVVFVLCLTPIQMSAGQPYVSDYESIALDWNLDVSDVEIVDDFRLRDTPPIYQIGVPSEISYFAYINYVLPRYLSLKPGDYSNVQISQGLVVNGNADENSRTFFVANNAKYIGLLVVTHVDGIFHSSFGFDENAIIDAVIANGIPISLYVDNGVVNIQMKYGTISMATGELSPNLEVFDSSAYRISYQLFEVVLNDVNFISADIASFATERIARSSVPVDLDVPFITNTACPCCRSGLCWAASIVSVGRFMNPQVGQPTTTLGLFQALNNGFPGTPIGTFLWHSRGFNQFGLLTSYITTGLNFSSLHSHLSAIRPVIFHITTAIGRPSHAIVLRTLESFSSTTFYGFMDPNYRTVRWVYASGPNQSINNSNFRYVGGGQTYTRWFSTLIASF